MSKIVKRRLFATAPSDTDVVGYNWYAGNDGFLTETFLSAIDAGTIGPVATTTAPEWILTQDILPEGIYQFAVTAVDAAGNESNPHQPAVWKTVPLDLTPPAAPTSGGIEIL